MIILEDIYWERANVHLKFNKNLKDFNIYLIRNNTLLKFKTTTNEIVFNITNTPEGEMLDKGNWKLIVDKEDILSYEEYVATLEDSKLNSSFVISSDLLKKLDDKSRIFRYRKGIYAYLVDFKIDENLFLYVRTDFMIVNRKYKKFYLFKESSKLIGKLKIFVKKCYLFFIKLMYIFFRIFKFNKKKNVLFLTENSDELTGNLKALYECVNDSDCNKKYFAFNNFIHISIIKKIFIYIYEVYLIATSDVIFVDNYTPKFTHLKLSKKAKLVQLWHAGVGFKSVGYARFGLSGSPHPYVSCHRNYTDAIVDQEKLIPIYQEVFGVKKDIFKALGMPRLDGYLKKEKIEEETKKLFRENSKFETHKVILFSPTYRGNGSRDAYYDYSLIDLDKVYKFCKKNNFIFVIKMHPFIDKSIEIDSKYQDLIFDYSSFDINKLIYVSDIMITDYSSCCYEYSLFDRPLIFYRFDKEIYEYLRPMHTVNAFTSKQDEVRTFDELMDCLDKYKNINIKDRFKNVSDIDNNSCSEIKKIFIGE